MKTREAWIVSGSTGEYSDAQDWAVRVFTSERAAKDFADTANDWLRKRSLHRESDPIADYEAREEARENPPEWDRNLSFQYTGTQYCVVGPVMLETVGAKMYLRLARNMAEESYVELGGSVKRSDAGATEFVVPTTPPFIVLGPGDIELMRKAVAEYDASITAEPR